MTSAHQQTSHPPGEFSAATLLSSHHPSTPPPPPHPPPFSFAAQCHLFSYILWFRVMTFSLVPSHGFGANVEPLGREEKTSNVLMFTKRLYIRSNTLVSICQPSRQLSIRFFWESVQGQWHSNGSPCQASEQDTGTKCLCVHACTFICASFKSYLFLKKKEKKRKTWKCKAKNYITHLVWLYINN